jgi:flagellar basal body rod protein FlgF
MVGKCDLSTASASALSGLRSASDRVDQDASTVAVAGARASDTVNISAAARAGDRMDDVSALVDMRIARYQFAAQVKVLRTVDEMSQDVLGLVSPKRG